MLSRNPGPKRGSLGAIQNHTTERGGYIVSLRESVEFLQHEDIAPVHSDPLSWMRHLDRQTHFRTRH